MPNYSAKYFLNFLKAGRLIKVRYICFFFFFILSECDAQLSVTNTPTVQQIAAQLTGPGIVISNVNYIGAPVSRGSFTASGTNLGLTSGIILMSGDIVDAVGPDSFPNAGQDVGQAGDPDLDTLAGAQTYDATILEFDFVPQNDTITFRYVFASEEYPEYVCSVYNDAFAFLLSGPGITGTINMAQIPGTAQPVTINSVNGGVVGANGTAGPACILGYSAYYTDNQGGATIEFDGFTVPLTAMAIVTPCQVYHLRIAVADAGDPAYDSAVFLEEGSLSATPIVYAGADQTICGNGGTLYLGISPVSGWTYNWSPASGLSNPSVANPVVTLSNTGTSPVVYSYVTTASNGSCVISDSVNITVVPTPVAPFTYTNPICQGQSTTLNYTGYSDTIASYLWIAPGSWTQTGSGQGPVNLTYTSPGAYPVTLIVYDHGCMSAPVTNTINVSAIPTVAATVPPVLCIGDTALLIASGSPVGPNAVYTWSYGSGTLISGGGTDSLQVLFANAGNVNITVSVQDSSCSSLVSTVPIVINPDPLATIVPPPSQCSGSIDSVFFLGTTNAGTTYNWDFGGSQVLSGTGAGPYALSWNSTGDYTISVTVTDGNCLALDSDVVHVDLQPQASFVTVDSLCANQNSQIQFNGIADSNTQYSWSLPGSSMTSSSQPGPFNLDWSTEGVFPLQLIINNAACSDTARDTILVLANPLANFTTSDVCIYDSIQLTNLTSLPDTNGVIYRWDFGDSGNSSQSQPMHLFSSFGDFNITLIVDAANGCSDTVAKAVRIYPKPVAAAIGDTVCFKNTSTFLNQSTIDQGSLSTIDWLIDSTYTSTGYYAQLVFNQTGEHWAQMIATSDHGCSDTTTTNAIVLRDPKPDFLPDYRQGCVPLTVNFTNLSTSDDDSIASWNWTYSDGGTDTSSTAEHTFSQTGLYSVNLHAVTQRGCVSDTFMTNLIDVHPLPVANFEYSPQPADIIIPSINFTDMSGPVSRWYWNFGDSTLSNDKDPIHIYEEAGTYNVQLIVENEFGCPDTTYRIIVIDDAYTLWVPNAFTPNGDGRNDEFMIKSTGITDIRMEIFSRWGREIFHSNSLYTGWDGRMDGGQAVEDTYVYRIVAKDRQQKEHIVVGHVTLYY